MDLGKAIGTACGTFAITNIDDIFVLVTFFAEASTGTGLTPLQITIGQYVGFTVIIIVSMIGFGASLLFSPEPIGFLGLLPLLLGVWGILDIVFLREEPDDPTTDPDAGQAASAAAEKPSAVRTWARNLGKVASVTVMNGADNIGTYVPLFSQAKGAEIAVYIVVYYILLGVWCLAAFLVMKQRHVLRLAQKYARVAVPFLYLGLGIFIIVQSECYPWSIEQIDDDVASHPGTVILAVVTTVLLLVCIGLMLWLRLRGNRRPAQPTTLEGEGADASPLDMGGGPTSRPTSPKGPHSQDEVTKDSKPLDAAGQADTTTVQIKISS